MALKRVSSCARLDLSASLRSLQASARQLLDKLSAKCLVTGYQEGVSNSGYQPLQLGHWDNFFHGIRGNWTRESFCSQGQHHISRLCLHLHWLTQIRDHTATATIHPPMHVSVYSIFHCIRQAALRSYVYICVITDSTASFFALTSGRASLTHPVFLRILRRIWRVANQFSLKIAVAVTPSCSNAAEAVSRIHQVPHYLVLLRSTSTRHRPPLLSLPCQSTLLATR